MGVNARGPHTVTVLGRHTTRRIRTSVIAVTAGLIGLLAALNPHVAPAGATTPPLVDVIVQQWDGADQGPAALVAQLGGQVTQPLPVVMGFAGRVPADQVATLAAGAGVRVVSLDNVVLPQLESGGTPTPPNTTPARADVYREAVGATAAAARGYTGAGSTVAVVDTGIADVAPLSGRIRNVV